MTMTLHEHATTWQRHRFYWIRGRFCPRGWHTNVNWRLDCSREAFIQPLIWAPKHFLASFLIGFFLWNCCFIFPFLHFIFTFSFLLTFGVPFCIWKWFFCSGCTKLIRKMCEKVKKKSWKSRKVSRPGLYKRILLVQKAVKSGQTKKSKLFNFLLSFYLLFGIVWKLVKCDQM